MSHFSRIKTRMVEKEFIMQALADMGYKPEAGDLAVRGFGGQKTPVEIKVHAGLFGNEIGLRRGAEAYEIVADWWGVVGTKQKDFVNHLTQRYAYHATRAKLAEQGFDLISEEVGAGGKIHLVLRRMA